jgi:3-phenylpropionate/trans-cinnamate dioxygenase ferredoxin reductase subunit
MDAERLSFRNADFFENNNIVVKTGTRAVSLDRDAKVLTDDRGEAHAYDDLLLATGARVRKLPVPGADLSGVFYLRDMDDVNAIEKSLPDAENVVVIGAGFIGLEFAAVARKQGKTVTVVEAAPRVMGRAVTEEISSFYEDLHREHGATVLTGAGVSELEGEGGKLTGVKLASGETVKAELAVVGIGVIANTEMAAEAGIECANGIVVDENGRTNDAHVYAAGDVAVYNHPFAGEPIRLESVQNAIDQAQGVAQAICGEAKTYNSIPWFWSDQYDVKLQMVGLTAGTDTHIVRGSKADKHFSIFHFRDGQLRSVDSINAAGDHMVARKLLSLNIPLTPEQAGDESFSLKDHFKANK